MVSRLVFAAAIGVAPLAAAYEELSCEPMPPTCWLCEHPNQDGTTYVWSDNPPGTGEFSIQGLPVIEWVILGMERAFEAGFCRV
jgi:hypothetical protein